MRGLLCLEKICYINSYNLNLISFFVLNGDDTTIGKVMKRLACLGLGKSIGDSHSYPTLRGYGAHKGSSDEEQVAAELNWATVEIKQLLEGNTNNEALLNECQRFISGLLSVCKETIYMNNTSLSAEQNKENRATAAKARVKLTEIQTVLTTVQRAIVRAVESGRARPLQLHLRSRQKNPCKLQAPLPQLILMTLNSAAAEADCSARGINEDVAEKSLTAGAARGASRSVSLGSDSSEPAVAPPANPQAAEDVLVASQLMGDKITLNPADFRGFKAFIKKARQVTNKKPKRGLEELHAALRELSDATPSSRALQRIEKTMISSPNAPLGDGVTLTAHQVNLLAKVYALSAGKGHKGYAAQESLAELFGEKNDNLRNLDEAQKRRQQLSNKSNKSGGEETELAKLNRRAAFRTHLSNAAHQMNVHLAGGSEIAVYDGELKDGEATLPSNSTSYEVMAVWNRVIQDAGGTHKFLDSNYVLTLTKSCRKTERNNTGYEMAINQATRLGIPAKVSGKLHPNEKAALKHNEIVTKSKGAYLDFVATNNLENQPDETHAAIKSFVQRKQMLQILETLGSQPYAKDDPLIKDVIALERADLNMVQAALAENMTGVEQLANNTQIQTNDLQLYMDKPGLLAAAVTAQGQQGAMMANAVIRGVSLGRPAVGRKLGRSLRLRMNITAHNSGGTNSTAVPWITRRVGKAGRKLGYAPGNTSRQVSAFGTGGNGQNAQRVYDATAHDPHQVAVLEANATTLLGGGRQVDTQSAITRHWGNFAPNAKNKLMRDRAGGRFGEKLKIYLARLPESERPIKAQLKMAINKALGKCHIFKDADRADYAREMGNFLSGYTRDLPYPNEDPNQASEKVQASLNNLVLGTRTESWMMMTSKGYKSILDIKAMKQERALNNAQEGDAESKHDAASISADDRQAGTPGQAHESKHNPALHNTGGAFAQSADAAEETVADGNDPYDPYNTADFFSAFEDDVQSDQDTDPAEEVAGDIDPTYIADFWKEVEGLQDTDPAEEVAEGSVLGANPGASKQ